MMTATRTSQTAMTSSVLVIFLLLNVSSVVFEHVKAAPPPPPPPPPPPTAAPAPPAAPAAAPAAPAPAPSACSSCNETEEFPKPVCGTDNNVYSSQCAMQRSACRQNVEIQPQDWDNCIDKQSLCPDKCLDLYDPVCGQDNIIYINYCVMQRKNCGKRLKTQELTSCMTRERQARKIECPESCAPIYEPVCDSLGDVHYNECFFRKAACGQENSIKILPLKACVNLNDRCPTKCLNINDPVCGSDGRRYQNHCKFAEENCRKDTKKMPWVYCLGEADIVAPL